MTEMARMLLDSINLRSLPPRWIGRLVAYEGSLIEIEGFPVPLLTPIKVETADGGSMAAEVVGFRNHRSLAMSLQKDAALAVGARVLAAGNSGMAGCGTQLLGRIIDGLGRPLDGQPLPGLSEFYPLVGSSSNPLERGRVEQVFDCGVRSINALLTIGEGQRVAIIAGSGVGKSVLMSQMLAGSNCDIIVAGLIGERAREVSDFVELRLPEEVRNRSVVVATAADEVPLLRLKAAMRTMAIAEYFRMQGKRVLLLLDSLTRVAHAQREIGLALGEPPALKGYPPSALSLIPRLVERAGRDRSSGGSITALFTVLADGGDLDDPVVDATRAIVDGHIVLSRSLAESGVYPAVDVGRSLSRTMADIADSNHQNSARRFRQLWSSYEENRDLVLMGAYTPGNDLLLDEAIERQPELRNFVAQAPDELVPFMESRAKLVEDFSL